MKGFVILRVKRVAQEEVFAVGDTVKHLDTHTKGTADILGFNYDYEKDELSVQTTEGDTYLSYITKVDKE